MFAYRRPINLQARPTSGQESSARSQTAKPESLPARIFHPCRPKDIRKALADVYSRRNDIWTQALGGDGVARCNRHGAARYPRTRIWLKLKMTRPPDVGRPKLNCGRNREKKSTSSSSRCVFTSTCPEMTR